MPLRFLSVVLSRIGSNYPISEETVKRKRNARESKTNGEKMKREGRERKAKNERVEKSQKRRGRKRELKRIEAEEESRGGIRLSGPATWKL